MNETIANNLCDRGGDVLAYLYQEMPTADRDAFELHLADCGTCIDDFAELSQARFPVYEWKKLEFESLPTPEIAIPYAAAASQASWLDKLRAALSLNPGLSAAGAFAALLIAFGIGYALFVQSPPDTDVAFDRPTPAVSQERPTTIIPVRPEVDKVSASVEKEPNRNAVPVKQSTRDVVRAKAVERKQLAPELKEKNALKKSEPRRDLTVPVLSAVEDDEDDSLRLADMFDEIGTSE